MNELEHYGVKGMQWGKRKDPDKPSIVDRYTTTDSEGKKRFNVEQYKHDAKAVAIKAGVYGKSASRKVGSLPEARGVQDYASDVAKSLSKALGLTTKSKSTVTTANSSAATPPPSVSAV